MLTENQIKQDRFKNIQSLRGIAALLVCAYHFRIAIINESWTQMAFGNGWIGVQLFFMISGFIMVHTTSRINDHFPANAAKFMLNRFIRIIPLYYLCTFLMIADDLNDGYLVTHGITLLKSLLFITPFDAPIGPEYGFPSLEVGWTLNYEMIFYVLFAISILFRKSRYFFMFATFFSLVVLIPILSGFGLSTDYKVYRDYPVQFLNMLSNPIWIHFIFGVCVGLLLPKLNFSKTVVKSSIPISIGAFLVYYTNITGIGFNAIYDLIFCGLLLVAFLINDVHREGFKLPDAIAGIGDKSYSIYLLHPIILGYLHVAFFKAGLRPLTENFVFFLFAIVVTILIASVFYKYIELKSTASLKKFFFGRKTIGK